MITGQLSWLLKVTEDQKHLIGYALADYANSSGDAELIERVRALLGYIENL
jgi:hypothetical protein